MLQKITIQNFRSLQNVTLNLQDVNVLIGANNSGKTNFLKALEFFRNFINDQVPKNDEQFKRICFQKKEVIISSKGKYNPITINLTKKEKPNYEYLYALELYSALKGLEYSQLVGFAQNEIKDDFIINDLDYILKFFYEFRLQVFKNTNFMINPFDEDDIYKIFTSKGNKGDFTIYRHNPGSKIQELEHIKFGGFLKEFATYDVFETQLVETFENLKIYQPDSSKLTKPYPLTGEKSVNANASNLVAFLDNMRDEFPEVYQNIVRDLHTCLEEFIDLRFQKVEPSLDSEERKLFGNQTFKKLGLADKFGNTYWAEELSEGTLYFLALLAIIHQPNPPKLLLLEEPERGTHPRRIKEVMKFIFDLAEQKKIQVILTTHSPLVLDQFKDFPQGVFIFDKDDDGATQVKNLLTDVIEPLEQADEAKGVEIDYTRDLGERWITGFFGGTPENIAYAKS
ncbi:MAG: AAA family ATPase [Microscillaceae bacterium]|jgi:predicted ATPase|nr:AAA family ATPase [Microscillaceae bacterium]